MQASVHKETTRIHLGLGSLALLNFVVYTALACRCDNVTSRRRPLVAVEGKIVSSHPRTYIEI